MTAGCIVRFVFCFPPRPRPSSSPSSSASSSSSFLLSLLPCLLLFSLSAFSAYLSTFFFRSGSRKKSSRDLGPWARRWLSLVGLVPARRGSECGPDSRWCMTPCSMCSIGGMGRLSCSFSYVPFSPFSPFLSPSLDIHPSSFPNFPGILTRLKTEDGALA